MRTTLNIDDELLKEAKIAAIERNSTLTRIIEEGLRKELAPERRVKRSRNLGLPAHIDPGDATAVSNFWKHVGDDWTLLRTLGPFPTQKGKPKWAFNWADSSALIEELEGPLARS